MKLLITILILVFAIACSSGGKSSAAPGGQGGGGTSGQCVSEIRACVGDPVLVPTQGGGETTTVSEIVPPGHYAALELEMLKKAGPQRAAVQKYFDDMGLRIYTIKNGQVSGPYWSTWLDNISLLKGCLTPGHLCVGENNYVWLGYRVVHQTITGFAMRISRPQPVDVDDREEGDLGVLGNAVDDLGDSLISNGCTKLPGSDYNYCVGEKFNDSNGEALITYINENPNKPTVILKNTATGKQSKLPAQP